MADPAQALRGIAGAKVAEEMPLAAYTTWRVGGPAQWLVTVSTERALAEALALVRENRLPLFILGKGSNVLVSDEGLRGVTLRLDGELAAVDIDGEATVAGAGASLARVVSLVAAAGLSGLEFATGIPGSVGGAVLTNAGAAGGSMAGALSEVVTLAADGEGGRQVYSVFTDRYRNALVPEGQVVVSATFRLCPDRVEAVQERTDQIRRSRQRGQPHGPSAGSVFKNPPDDFAGRLIEQCGLKGERVGGASVSEQHANFMITDAGATASDVKALIDLVREKVGERFGVQLELEVVPVGFEER